MLAIIFFLALTLVNVYVYRQSHAFVVAHDYAMVQVPHRLFMHVERDFAIWREIGIAVITILVFGTIASIGRLRSSGKGHL